MATTAAPSSLDTRATVRLACDLLSDLHEHLEVIGYFDTSEKDDYRLRLALADISRVGQNIDRVVHGNDPR